MTKLEVLKNEVKQVIIALEAIASATYPVAGFGDGYKKIGINFSLKACEIAAEITGANPTFCKMLNYEFRSAALDLMCNRAMVEVA